MHSLAQHLQSQGRGNDSMLVHMTPREVGGLQALAQAHGGTLTRNPTTGLPEAGFLDSILPMIAGIGLNFLLPGLGAAIGGGLGGFLSGSAPLASGLLVGGGTALATGDIGKGLMAGLGAYGGAGLGETLSGLGAGANAAAQTTAADMVNGVTSTNIPTNAASTIKAASAAKDYLEGSPWLLEGGIGSQPTAAALEAAAGNIGTGVASTGPAMATLAGQAAPTLSNMGAGIGQLGTKQGLSALGGLSTTQMAGIGIPLLSAMYGIDNKAEPVKEDKPTVSLSQPKPLNRQVQFPTNQRLLSDSSEFQYFTPVGGEPSTITRLTPTMGLARGGNVDLEDGAFVVDARTVSELGNGSSSAGQELLARMGGRPIHGPGDGVSDSIHANIGGRQEARVARDEVKFSPDAVKRVGGGSAKKGAQRLYDLMHKAQQARKKAARGEDTGLAALVAKEYAGGGKASADRTPEEEKQWRDSTLRMYDYGRLMSDDPIAYLGYKTVGAENIKPWKTPLNVAGLYFKENAPAADDVEQQMFSEMGIDPMRSKGVVGVGPEAWNGNEYDPIRHELRHAGFSALGHEDLRSVDRNSGVGVGQEAANRLMDILTQSKNAQSARQYLSENYSGNFKRPEKAVETMTGMFSKRLGDLSARARKKNAGKGD